MIGATASTYEIVAKLAEGGMAEIFLARGANEAGVERYVVLKRIIRERANDVELVRMFLDEARLAAQLQHPNIAQVYDVGRLGESYFFTMEYVHGETVRAVEKRAAALAKPVPISVVLAVAAGAAAGLHHAHDRKGVGGKPLGIVHRDVSPSNLLIGYEGHVKLVDFGVAKAADRATTASGKLKGKIAYLSPEQAQARPADRRSDLFALGIVLWELLAGERLYDRDSDYLSLTAIVEEPAPDVREKRADVPAELAALVGKLLEKDPAARFQTARETGDEAERIAERAGIGLTPGALARFMREWFGERSEPWIDVEIAKHPSIVSVKSEPIPQKLPTSPTVADDPLRAVPSLSVIELGPGQLKATIVAAPVATLRGVGPEDPSDAAPTLYQAPRARSVAPPPRKSPLIAIAAAVGLAGAVGLVLAIARPWQHASPPDATLVSPSPAPSPSPSPTPLPTPPAPADAALAASQTPDAALAASAPADAPAPAAHHPATPHPATPHPHPNLGSASAKPDDCANDPMACQR